MSCGTPAAQGAQGRLATLPGAPTIGDPAEDYDWAGGNPHFQIFNYERLTRHGRIIGARGITGSRSSPSERTRFGANAVRGVISIDISPADLDIWLPRILGGTKGANATDAFDVTNPLPTFGVLIDRVTDVFQYSCCVVNQAVFRSKAMQSEQDEAELIEMIIDIIGFREKDGFTFPDPTYGTALENQPYVHSDGELILTGKTATTAPRIYMDAALIIDNHLHSRFTNSIWATSITPRARTVALRTRHPFTPDELDLYDQALEGAAGTLTWTNQNVSTRWDFATLQVPALSPNIRGKVEIPLYLDMIARQVGYSETPAEVRAVNDSDSTT